MQLPEQKEISIGTEWILPSKLADILSSRFLLSIKTPFVGYQTTNLQAILGQQEDSNILGLIALYTESLQYSITVTGILMLKNCLKSSHAEVCVYTTNFTLKLSRFS